MSRWRIDVAYDGAAYAGWQIQPQGASIQETIEKALETITGAKARVHGSGRTDQGVHALGQVAHFDLQTTQNAEALKKGINAVLPQDIRVNRVRPAKPDFHARLSATAKEYRYLIWNSNVVPPFLRHYRTHVVQSLDIEAMQEAASYLVGRHDFASFTANPNRLVESTVRVLSSLVVRKQGREAVVIAIGDGFLYKMMRSICGLLIRVGNGSVPPREVRDILQKKVRTAAVPTAPPQGLFLWKVYY